VTFTATGTAGAAIQIAVNAGNGQTAAVNTAVATPPSARVTDAYGNPLNGVSVTFAVASGGGTVVPTTAILTNGSGIAPVTSWTLGTTPGTNTLTATSPGLSGSPVTFTAIGADPISAAQSLITVSQDTVRSDSSVTLALQARDQFGNPLTTGGSTVVFSASGGTSTGTISSTTDHGDGTYTATFTGLVAGTADTIYATVNGSAVTTTPPTVVVIPDFATRLLFHVQPSDAAANATITPAVVVYAVDNAGNIDPNYQFGVALQITSGTGTTGASLTGGGPVLAVLGVATFAGVRIDLPGSGYRLDAIYIASPPYSLTSATSSTFTIH
jgi:hypothetical protein